MLNGIRQPATPSCAALIVLAAVFSMTWYKMVMQYFLVVYNCGICHLLLVFSWYYTLAYRLLCIERK